MLSQKERIMKKVFIDGSAGTTGLRIYDRLARRDDIKLITISEQDRKDISRRKEAISSCDIAFLCLPDDAAREVVEAVESDTVIIDTSTAHRTDERFAYGFAELSDDHRDRIATSKYIAVPGCHASGFIALVYPLIEAGIVSTGTLLTCFSLTGYSGGGKQMIARYEAEDRSELLGTPRQYALTQNHKHLAEMCAVTGLSSLPIFTHIVSDFYSGMQVCVPIFKSQLSQGKCVEDIKDAYRRKYTGLIVKFIEDIGDVSTDGFVATGLYAGLDGMGIAVTGCDERILLVALYDNLGKGASGAAIQCMNIVMGTDETAGLALVDDLRFNNCKQE